MEKMMLQQVMTAPKNIVFNHVPIPEAKEGQVLVKIKKIGVCGSDIHVYHGKHPFTKYPITQGHEVSGQIVGLGEGVKGFKLGQKVIIEPQVYCGACYPCTHGKYNLCEELKVMGFQTTGTASEYFAVDAAKVTLIRCVGRGGLFYFLVIISGNSKLPHRNSKHSVGSKRRPCRLILSRPSMDDFQN